MLVGLALLPVTAASTAWNLGKAQSDWDLPTLLPDDPDLALRAAANEFRLTGRIPGESTLDAAKTAAGLDPLEEEPLVFASLAQPATSNSKAIELLAEARRRNPAAREARVLLLDRYLRTNNMPGAIGEIGALSSLQTIGGKQLSQLLLNLVAAPDTRRDAVAALRQSPLRKPLLVDLAAAGASSYLLLDLSRDLRAFQPGSDDARWSQSVTQALVSKGDIMGAKRLWLHYFNVPPQKVGVFDGKFAGLAGAPFGWEVTSSPAGYAEFAKGGLSVYYEGRDAVVLARELLMLPPGQYRISYTFASQDGPLPNVAWRVVCADGSTSLLNLSLAETYSFEREQSPGFSVPADGCQGQWLTLEGRSLAVPAMRSALVKNLSIKAVR